MGGGQGGIAFTQQSQHDRVDFNFASGHGLLLERQQWAAAAWRADVAWVAQEPGLVNGIVGDNVALGGASGIAEALRDAGADFGPDKAVGDDGEGLSAGERRRVALARALVRIRVGGARLLILDEPTAGLVAATEARVVDAVRATGAGALIVSHRAAVLAAADRVVSVAAMEVAG